MTKFVVRSFTRLLVVAVSLAVLSGGNPVTLFAADTNAPIDWNRARELFRKSQQGEQLSPEDQAYLDRARAERAVAEQAAGRQKPAPWRQRRRHAARTPAPGQAHERPGADG